MDQGDAFKTIIHRASSMRDAYIEIPREIQKTFGNNTVNVRGIFDGYPYEETLLKTGTGYIMIISDKILQTIGKKPGEEIYV